YVWASNITGGAGTDLLDIHGSLSINAATFSAASSGFEKIEVDPDIYGGSTDFEGGSDNNFDFSGFTVVGGAYPKSGLTIDAGVGTDSVTGTSLNDIILGGDGDDVLNGGAGDDALTGGNGDDTLKGGPGNDTLDGNSGTNIAVFSGNYADYTFHNVDSGFSVTGGIDGTDTLSNIQNLQFADQTIAASALHFAGQMITGTADNDTLTGSADDDTILGLAGDDQLSGGGGNDTINGGLGNDNIDGGGGSNTAV